MKKRNKKTQDEAQPKKMSKIREKIDMYDMILANLIAGNSVVEPSQPLRNSELAIGFSNISSETQISKYFIIRQFPDYMCTQLFDLIRSRCVRKGIKINFYTYGNPYKINWDSAEMRNKMSIWRQYSEEMSNNISVFDYRNTRSASLAKERIVMSTKYLNEAELDHKRSLIRTAFMIEISAFRDDESMSNMIESIRSLKEVCSQSEIKLRELKINMIDWMKTLGVFSLKSQKEVDTKISRKILTDDILANFNGYKQGRVGNTGISLGIDVLSSVPVMRKFKADPDAAENWLISAETGGGKSFYVKSLLTYLLADGFVVTVMDYEGDEYDNIANFIRDGNPEDVKVISLGKGSSIYFDPVEISDLTGQDDVDCDLKEQAVSYIIATFRLIVAGIAGTLDQWEERVISNAISRVYDASGVTEDKTTWHRSKGLRLKDIYEEIRSMVETKELADESTDNVKHRAAVKIAEASSIYFEEGESKAGCFRNPMPANELFKAKFIVFSFGMRGAGESQTDPVILALKQLSVANITIQISNYCKYVKRCFNVKVWEEFQRWGRAHGSTNIIMNAMTGGRKRGYVNFIITNDLASMLDEGNPFTAGLSQNIQNYAIGKINNAEIRHKFCEKFSLIECEKDLERISKANTSDDTRPGVSTASGSSGNRYKHAFCLVLDSGKKAIVKAILPPSLTMSNIFKTGVDTKKK